MTMTTVDAMPLMSTAAFALVLAAAASVSLVMAFGLPPIRLSAKPQPRLCRR